MLTLLLELLLTIKQQKIIARKNRSHQGVLSDWTSLSLSPISKETPGKRILFGAGGTARSTNHKIGTIKSITRTHGVINPNPQKKFTDDPLKPDKAILVHQWVKS